MTLFAQSRIERLASRTRAKVPTATTTTPVNCSAMAVGGAFDPNANPGTGGWMLDVIDGTPPAGGGALGDDLMAGPLLAEGDGSGVDGAGTLAKRATFAAAWFGGTDTNGCGSDTKAILQPTVPLAYTRFVDAVPDSGAMDWRFVDVLERLEGKHHGGDLARLTVPDQLHLALVLKQHKAVLLGQRFAVGDQLAQVAFLGVGEFVSVTHGQD